MKILLTVLWFHALALFLPVSAVILYRRPGLWHHLIAVFLGALIAIVDSASDEVQLTVLLLLVFGFFLGFSNPARAWRWAVLLGVFVPLAAVGRSLADGHFSLTGGMALFVALGPAMGGAYGGVMLRKAAPRLEQSTKSAN